jgi:hypothetical protein
VISRRRIAFASIAIMIGALGAGGALVAADLYLHHRAERSAGLNRWGYRGPVLPRKASDEIRVAMLGGSTVFGYGTLWHEAAPAALEQQLRQAHPRQPIHVVNLGYNNDGAHAAMPTLEDYRYLEYDVVILYEGYNDLAGDDGPNLQVYRRQSPVFRLTGYSPLLPLWLEEKAWSLRGRQPGGKTVFKPDLASRTSAAAFETASSVGEMLGRQLAGLSTPAPAAAPSGSDCARPWSQFCDAIVRATVFARSLGASVLIVTPPLSPVPNMRARSVSQQASLSQAIAKRFATDRGVAYQDLSSAIDLSDTTYSFDTMHLGPQGNWRLATLMLPVVEQLAWPSRS